ncbi:MAG: phosphotransferase enzyme family protein [Sphaerochaetaceae bacterium]
MMTGKDPIGRILHGFAIYGDLMSYQAMGGGHINTTIVSMWNQGGTTIRYTHQKINRRVFAHPDELMRNIQEVTSHIRNKLIAMGDGAPTRHVLSVVPAWDGRLFVQDDTGEYWRTYVFIERVFTYDHLDTPLLAQRIGGMTGRFQNLLRDYAGNRLYETIPHFHDMPWRYRQLETTVSENRFGRLQDCGSELAFLMENRERGMIISDALSSGAVPEGITHNDMKLNNILFDSESKTPVCMIDLDTVMMNSSMLFDTGDLIRTATITGLEDETDLGKIGFDLKLYKALVGGYLQEAGSFLTQTEKSLIGESGRTITQIMAVRFLTDYLSGDVYYRTDRPRHNLERTRTQIALMRSMDAQWSAVEAYTESFME